MIFVSQRDADGTKTPMWKLYNDTETQFFMDWNEVVTFCLSSKCIPTLLFYEVAPPVYKGTKSQQKDLYRFSITTDQFEILQIKVMEQDQYMDNFLGDQQFMEEQMQMLNQLEKTRSQEKNEASHNKDSSNQQMNEESKDSQVLSPSIEEPKPTKIQE